MDEEIKEILNDKYFNKDIDAIWDHTIDPITKQKMYFNNDEFRKKFLILIENRFDEKIANKLCETLLGADIKSMREKYKLEDNTKYTKDYIDFETTYNEEEF
ncbi:MAG: hypothetical protein ACOCZ5_01490 [bacterium]